MTDTLNNNLYQTIDEVFLSYILEHPDLHERWLLQQTLYTGTARRPILGLLPLHPGMKILDLGSGFGAVSFDLAATQSVEIEAVDADAHTNEIAQSIHTQLQTANGLLPDSSIRFVEGNAYDLPFEDDAFDLVISRFLFQHLAKPTSAMKEIHRVLKPGSFACIIDIDDQFTISYPEESPAFTTLKTAFGTLQQKRGGDRFVGRKLASYMQQADLEVASTVIQPAAQFFRTDENGLSHQLTLQRFTDARDAMIEHEILAAEEFDECLQQVQTIDTQWQFASNGQMIVLGQK